MLIQLFAMFGSVIYLAVAIAIIVIAICAVLIVKELKLINKQK